MSEENEKAFENIDEYTDGITPIREVCETDEGIKALFPEPEIHNSIFYAERFLN